MPDGKSLLVRLIPEERGELPKKSLTPAGPVIQESTGAAAPVRTYQDLLKSPHDEELFEFYATSQLALVSIGNGGSGMRRFGEPSVFIRVDPSPDGRYLCVVRARQPYSYLVPYRSFSRTIEVWDLDGKLIRKIAELPASETVPIQGVPEGPRSLSWRPDREATLIWAEALDGGDPRREVSHRDKLMTLASPFIGEATEITRTEHRFQGLTWREQGGTALLREYDRDRRWRRTWLIDVDSRGGEPRLLWDLSAQDAYGDPGSPLMRSN
ncbi:S9 family peptidase, partial [Candidatus Sumerlaeota bacterium]|nr:S9 family peptidase [Candidatus Sumerlaeota bacterium]